MNRERARACGSRAHTAHTKLTLRVPIARRLCVCIELSILEQYSRWLIWLGQCLCFSLRSFLFSVSVFKENVCCLRPRECEYIRKQKL